MNATGKPVDAMGSPGGARTADAADEIEGSPSTDKETLNVSKRLSPYCESTISTTQPPVGRYVRADGKIGVIVSRGYQHSSWSTRIRLLLDPRDPATPAKTRIMEEIAIFDKEVVAAVLEGHISQARRIAIAKMGLASQNQITFTHVELGVEWVDPGDEFEVKGDSDFETVRLKNCIEWWRA